jgi:hypothetical protein
MNKIAPSLVVKCRNLRRKGFTLREISKLIGIPFTTIYGHVADIPISLKLKEKIRLKQIENTNRLIKFNIEIRKGKCILGRIVPKPKGWSYNLIYLTAHFMFDGEINNHSCIYNNRNKVLINRVRTLMKEVFNLEPRAYLNKETGVHRISYHYVELATYILRKSKELLEYTQKATKKEKIIFLKVFFDDEGCVGLWGKKRLVRGYQNDLNILELVQKLLKDFVIESTIDTRYKEIIISRKENLIKFQDKINFSEGIYINPDRKNSIWKQKLEKRQILQTVINSYKL